VDTLKAKSPNSLEFRHALTRSGNASRSLSAPSKWPSSLAKLADIFEVSADVIVGRNAPAPKRNGPKGKLEKLFEVARDLPRSQQEKITAFLESFVNEHASA
jgi:hypothetical protein